MASFLDNVSRRFRFGFGYQRVALDPPPETLAHRLREAQVAVTAAQRLDDFDRLHHQHIENRKAHAKLVLGTFGIVLGTAPSVPGVVNACLPGAQESAWGCGARLSALMGSVIALGVTLWSAYDLYMHPTHLADQIAKLNDELERAMHARNGEAPVTGLLHTYQQMSDEERAAFRARLHEHTREPAGSFMAATLGATTDL